MNEKKFFNLFKTKPKINKIIISTESIQIIDKKSKKQILIENLKKEINQLDLNQKIKNKLHSLLKKMQKKENNLEHLGEKFTKILSLVLDIENSEFENIKFKNEKEKIKQIIFNGIFKILENEKIKLDESYQLISNIINESYQTSSKKNIKSGINIIESLNSLNHFIDNPNYTHKIHYQLVLNITENASFHVSDELEILNKLINNPVHQDYHSLILKITENEGQKITNTLEHINAIINNPNYNPQDHYKLILKITEDTKYNISEKLYYFNELINSNYNRKEYYQLFLKIMKKTGKNSYDLLDSFNKIINNLNYNHQDHYHLISNLIENSKTEKLNLSLLFFNDFLNSPFIFKIKYKEKILNKISNENLENFMIFFHLLSNLYENIYKTKNSQEFLDKMLFLDFILPLSSSYYVSFFKKLKKAGDLGYDHVLKKTFFKNEKLEKINKTILNIDEKIKRLNEKEKKDLKEKNDEETKKIENNQEKNENSQYNLSNFHPLAILKIYDFLYSLQEEQENKQKQKNENKQNQIRNIYGTLSYDELVYLIINNIFLFKKIDNIFDFQRFTIEDLLENKSEKDENENKKEKTGFNLYEELNTGVLKDTNLNNKGVVNE